MIQTEYSEIKGKQLLEVMKTKKDSGLPVGGAKEDQIEEIRMELSERRTKAIEMVEKLAAANETIAALEDRVS